MERMGFKLIYSYYGRWEEEERWVNELYCGGETKEIVAPSKKIQKLLNEIENTNPKLLKLIKEVYVSYWKSEYRGSGSNRGIIIGDKDFLSLLVKEAYFEWLDKAWGDWAGTLVWDQEVLRTYDFTSSL